MEACGGAVLSAVISRVDHLCGTCITWRPMAIYAMGRSSVDEHFLDE